MEYYSENGGFLEELLAMRNDPSWESTTIMNEFHNTGFLSYDEETHLPINLPPHQNSPFLDPPSSSSSSFQIHDQTMMMNCDLYNPLFGYELSAQLDLTDSSCNTPPFLSTVHHDHYSLTSLMADDEEQAVMVENGVHGLGEAEAPSCKMEQIQSTTSCEVPSFEMGLCTEEEEEKKKKKKNSKVKKVEGQPSKNLMAERRRRKRLNDRLSMLRSVVPKISKMDRTSILGDTIDYMKELLERINNLREEVDVGPHHHLTIFKDVNPNDILLRNSPKFDVERRNGDTRVDICCSGKPGLLLSTVTTLEAFGLEIQQCVISCFNNFAMQASCSEEMEHREIISSEDIKQALFRNAGYGGRCL